MRRAPRTFGRSAGCLILSPGQESREAQAASIIAVIVLAVYARSFGLLRRRASRIVYMANGQLQGNLARLVSGVLCDQQAPAFLDIRLPYETWRTSTAFAPLHEWRMQSS